MAKLGTWKHAPLSYVVAEVTFPAIDSDDERLGKARKLLLNEFPAHDKIEIEALRQPAEPESTQKPESHQILDFRSIDNNQGVRLGPTGVQLHSVLYTNFKGFKADFALLTKVLDEALAPKHYLRIGLRYIDVIVPDEPNKAEDYLIDPMRIPFLLENSKPVRHDVVLQLQGEDYFCRVRAHHNPPPGQTLPPNFMAMQIALSAQQKKAMAYTKKENDGIIILDIDTGTLKPMIAESVSLDDKLDALHSIQRQCFLNSMSALALGAWK